VAREKFFHDAVNAIGFGPTGLHLFSARVAAFGGGSERLAAQKASGL
jgi:hypothetical protein